MRIVANTSLAAVAALAFGCGVSDRDQTLSASDGVVTGGGTETGSTSSTPTTGDSSGGGTDSIRLDVPGPGETTGVGGSDTDGEECGSFTEHAQEIVHPADIILVVDNSSSMHDEIGWVKDELNGFSQQIAASGVDARVILISRRNGTLGVCIDPPLGNGACPGADSNPPGYTHVEQTVMSRNALESVLARHAWWAPMIRPDSTIHVVIISDDESSMHAQTFADLFSDLSPDYDDMVGHGIVPESECEDAVQVGQTYLDLARMTGGIIGDLCEQDFQPVFDALATAVITGSISCDWPIPEPEPGETADPTKVNVEFDDGMGTVEIIGHVQGPTDCANVVDGWYYDDNAMPTRIIACPQTCDRIQSVASGSVTVTIGCDTKPAIPQ